MAAALIAGALLVGGLLVAFGLNRGEPRYLAVGDAAPDFSLPAASGGTVSLSQYVGKSNVLLFFSMGTG